MHRRWITARACLLAAASAEAGLRAGSFGTCAARDEEEGCIDVGTVAGYRRVVMCQEVCCSQPHLASASGLPCWWQALLTYTSPFHMCMQVRDEIEAVLGHETSVKEVLLAMCDRRLIPTPWLNQARGSPWLPSMHSDCGQDP